MNFSRWRLMLEAMQETGSQIIHEFPDISKGGISVRIENLPKGQFRKCSYLRDAPPLELEFLAYKILEQIKKCRLLGPFTSDTTHFSANKKIGANSEGVGTPIIISPLFVVKRNSDPTNVDKWREVTDYGFEFLPETSINSLGYE